MGLGHAEDPRAAMINEIDELFGRQPEIDWHQHRADLRHRVKRLELRVRVGRDVRDPVALTDAQRLERGRPAIATLEELGVGPAFMAVDERLPVRVQPSRAPHEVEWRQRHIHAGRYYPFSRLQASGFGLW